MHMHIRILIHKSHVMSSSSRFEATEQNRLACFASSVHGMQRHRLMRSRLRVAGDLICWKSWQEVMNGRTSAKTIICGFISLQIIFYGIIGWRGSYDFIAVLFILRIVVSLDEGFNVVQLDGTRQWLVQIRCYWDMPATYPQIRAMRRMNQICRRDMHTAKCTHLDI